jgi:sporulation protein YlmC with PRC-barrel domain
MVITSMQPKEAKLYIRKKNLLTESDCFHKNRIMDNMKHRRLQELKRSDFDIVDGEPDIRGWDVKTAQGQKIGEVEELIVDAQKKKVRYMVVELDDDELDLDDDREVLIPIGLAQLHKEDDDVILPNVKLEQLLSLPEYDEDRLDDAVERQICSALGRSSESMTITPGSTNRITDTSTSATAPGTTGLQQENTHQDNFYNHDYFNDDNLYKDRLHLLPDSRDKESDYERGLRLWEKRSKGGIVSEGNSSRMRDDITGREEGDRERQRKEELEAVRNRRNKNDQRDDLNRDSDREDTDRYVI